MENNSSDSDYEVNDFITPDIIEKPSNGDAADLLGNFDDDLRKRILKGKYLKNGRDENDSANEESDAGNENEVEDDNSILVTEEDPIIAKTYLTGEQVSSLLRGRTKSDRYILYVTNLNFETSKTDLQELFGTAGSVKSVRIPKKKKGFAFVEMSDIDSYQKGLQLHNTILCGRTIKIQITESGKNRSANKRNILKQKNRKLAEMRHESKAFTRSGKFYDKSLKQDKAKELLMRKRWRTKPRNNGPKS